MMIHFLARHSQYELHDISVNSCKISDFSLDFSLYSLAFFNVKEKIRKCRKV